MATPSQFSHLPLGCLRACRRGPAALSLWARRPWVHEEVRKFAPHIPAGERTKSYFVLACPLAWFDRTGAAFTVTIGNTANLKIRGFDTYDEAEAKYAEWAALEGAAVARHLAGLRQIGSED